MLLPAYLNIIQTSLDGERVRACVSPSRTRFTFIQRKCKELSPKMSRWVYLLACGLVGYVVYVYYIQPRSLSSSSTPETYEAGVVKHSHRTSSYIPPAPPSAAPSAPDAATPDIDLYHNCGVCLPSATDRMKWVKMCTNTRTLALEPVVCGTFVSLPHRDMSASTPPSTSPAEPLKPAVTV